MSHTGWITDFENDEEVVLYSLIDGGDLLLSQLNVQKPIHDNNQTKDSRFIFSMKKETFIALYNQAVERNIIVIPKEMPMD